MTHKTLLLSLVFLLLLGLFSGLSTLELRAEEPRRAVIAMEMYYSGEWIVPKIHGENYYNKPPLFNWVLASAFTLFGSTAEWVVRLPSLLAWCGTALVLFFFSRKYLSEKVGVLAAFFLITFGDILFYGSINSGEIDLFFSSIIFLQIAAIFHFGQSKRYLSLFLISYLLTVLAFLTKGLPALAFQAITLLAYLIYTKQWKLLFHWKHFLGIALFFSLTGLYFYAYQRQEPILPFLVNLTKESTQRSVSEHDISAVSWQFLAFFPNLFKLLLPWSLLLFWLFKKGTLRAIWQVDLIRFSITFILANIFLYALSPGTLNRYLYPFFPFFSILYAYLLVEHSRISYRSVLYLLLFLGITRIAINFSLLPHQQTNAKQLMYRNLNEELWQITAGEKIYWTGKPHQWKATPTLFGLELANENLQTPPLLPYQIPYYLEHTGKYVFDYHPQAKSDTFYLAYQAFIVDKEVEIFHEFQELWTKQQMVLVKFK